MRGALSFSKKVSNHIGAIRYFICAYTLTKYTALPDSTTKQLCKLFPLRYAEGQADRAFNLRQHDNRRILGY